MKTILYIEVQIGVGEILINNMLRSIEKVAFFFTGKLIWAILAKAQQLPNTL